MGSISYLNSIVIQDFLVLPTSFYMPCKASCSRLHSSYVWYGLPISKTKSLNDSLSIDVSFLPLAFPDVWHFYLVLGSDYYLPEEGSDYYLPEEGSDYYLPEEGSDYYLPSGTEGYLVFYFYFCFHCFFESSLAVLLSSTLVYCCGAPGLFLGSLHSGYCFLWRV